jgi:polyhydroxyalkanoate synthesis regulator phasin
MSMIQSENERINGLVRNRISRAIQELLSAQAHTTVNDDYELRNKLEAIEKQLVELANSL